MAAQGNVNITKIEQKTKLSTLTQIQLGPILEMDTQFLLERIRRELDENPALESRRSDDEYTPDSNQGDDRDTDRNDDDYRQDYGNDSYKSTDTDLDDPDWNMRYAGSEEVYTPPVVYEKTLEEYLMEQFGQTEGLTERQMHIAEKLVGSLDSNGYLRDSISMITNNIMFYDGPEYDDITTAEVEEVHQLLCTFDPPGIGAIDVIDCILIQLRMANPNLTNTLAIKMVHDHTDAFIKKHYDKLSNALGISEKEVMEVMRYIVDTVSPRPGSAYTQSSDIHRNTIIPDFEVHNEDGQLVLTMPNTLPELYISESFSTSYQRYNEQSKRGRRTTDDEKITKHYYENAQNFMQLLKMRRETMLSTMRAIMVEQKKFFYTGDHSDLKPMVLKDIAEKTGYNVSTLSRATTGKYVSTDFGMMPLKGFFSEGLTIGDDEVSNKAIKSALQEIINGENKRHPQSDESLRKALSKRGYNVARRTVAKYRESMQIPVARLRKEV